MGKGRPSKLDDDLTADLCRYLQLGCYVETAAAMCGLDRNTFQSWAKRGAREKDRRNEHEEQLAREEVDDKQRVRKIRKEERERRSKRADDHAATSEREQGYVDFHSAVEKAIAQAELGDLGIVSLSAKGGHVLEKRTLPDGTVIEKRSKPEWQAAAWKLERRNPKRWARTQRFEVTGDEDKPVAFTLADAVKAAYVSRKEREAKAGTNGARIGLNGSGNGVHIDETS